MAFGTQISNRNEPDVTATGWLPHGLSIRLLGMADLPAIIELRRQVIAELDDPDHYVPEEPAFVQDHIAACGLTIGIFEADELIAYGALGLSGTDHAEMVAALKLEPDQFAHLASCMVVSRWRQHGLHNGLIQARIDYGLRLGRRHFGAMVSPRNEASWSNLMQRGFHLRVIADFPDGRRRYLVHKDVTENVTFDESTFQLCESDDIDGQRKLLAAGFRGYQRVRRDGKALVGFALPSRIDRSVPDALQP
mgnify:CR=1 FL=1